MGADYDHITLFRMSAFTLLLPAQIYQLLYLGVGEHDLARLAAEREETPAETAAWLIARYEPGTVPLLVTPGPEEASSAPF